jgi:hypothetical protein
MSVSISIIEKQTNYIFRFTKIAAEAAAEVKSKKHNKVIEMKRNAIIPCRGQQDRGKI